MKSFIRLLRNDLYKCIINKTCFLSILVMLVGVAIAGLYNDKLFRDDSWKEMLLAQNESICEYINEAKIVNERIIKYYDTKIAENLYCVENNIKPSNFYNDVATMLSIDIFVEMFFIIIFASFIVNEYVNKTFNHLVCSPNKIGNIYLSQFITGFILIIVLLLILFVTSLTVAGIKNGFSEMFKLTVYSENTDIIVTTVFIRIVRTLLFFVPQYVLNWGIVFMVSHITRNSIISSAVPMFMVLSGTIIADTVTKSKFGVIWPYVHTNMNQYFEQSKYYEYMTVGKSLLIVFIYVFIGYICAYFTSKRKCLFS